MDFDFVEHLDFLSFVSFWIVEIASRAFCLLSLFEKDIQKQLVSSIFGRGQITGKLEAWNLFNPFEPFVNLLFKASCIRFPFRLTRL